MFRQECGPQFLSVFQSVLYVKKAEHAQRELLPPGQVPHPGACFPASWSHGKGDFLKPPRVTAGDSGRAQTMGTVWTKTGEGMNWSSSEAASRP